MQKYINLTDVEETGGLNNDTVLGQTMDIKYLFEEINTVEVDWKS